MKQILILGAGTGGTLMANLLSRRLPRNAAHITVIDRDNQHLYQPGLLLLPFGKYQPKDLLRPRSQFLPPGVEFLIAEVDRIDPEAREVRLAGGRALPYDTLIVATGSRLVPEETPGLVGEEWLHSIFEFYTLDGAITLGERLRAWPGGRLVVHIKELPIKCPVAPLEFAFLADAFFREQGRRDQVTIEYVTPLSGAFTQPIASEHLGALLTQRGVKVTPDFDVERVEGRRLIAYDGREVPFDLLVEIPTHMGDALIDRSGLGDELGFIPTHPKTLQSKAYPSIFAIGDATNIAASKAGSVAHFEADVLTDNVERFLDGRVLDEGYDGHANCFVETGGGKGLLIDFNMAVQPLPGDFPFPVVGPLRLLRESRLNHWGKLAFRWVYWNLLLRGRPIPFVPTRMSMRGKVPPAGKAA